MTPILRSRWWIIALLAWPLWVMGDAADEVRATEQAFADTMAARDLAAFSAFLA